MQEAITIEDRIAAQYTELSAQLRNAAEFVARHPVDVATRSLRSVAGQTGLAPATFSRLARALGFESYEELREVARTTVSRNMVPFSEQAGRLQDEATNDNANRKPFLQRQSEACVGNVDRMTRAIDTDRLETVADKLAAARRVTVVGALGSAAFADYFAYMANWFADSWSVIGSNGVTSAAAISKITPEDAYIVICKRPFVRRSLKLAEMAAESGAYVLVISDSHACPALKHGSAGFVLPTESPQFFPSYAATLVFIETLIGMLVTRAGPDARKKIEAVEENNRQLEEFWAT